MEYYWIMAKSIDSNTLIRLNNIPIASVYDYGIKYENLNYTIDFGHAHKSMYHTGRDYGFKFRIIVNNNYYGHTLSFQALDCFEKIQTDLIISCIEAGNNYFNMHYIGELQTPDDPTLVDHWINEGF